MKVVEIKKFGGPEVLKIGLQPIPTPKKNEVLIMVKAAGINRPDILQREGKYPPPKGASDILGLEVAGKVSKIGKDVKNIKVGDNVCALVSGGGYAEYCSAPYTQCLPIPSGLTYEEASTLPGAAKRRDSNADVVCDCTGASRNRAHRLHPRTTSPTTPRLRTI